MLLQFLGDFYIYSFIPNGNDQKLIRENLYRQLTSFKRGYIVLQQWSFLSSCHTPVLVLDVDNEIVIVYLRPNGFYTGTFNLYTYQIPNTNSSLPYKYRNIYKGVKNQCLIRVWQGNQELLVILDCNNWLDTNGWLSNNFITLGIITICDDLTKPTYRDVSAIDGVTKTDTLALYMLQTFNPNSDDQETFHTINIEFNIPRIGSTSHKFNSNVKEFDTSRILTRKEINDGYKILFLKTLEADDTFICPEVIMCIKMKHCSQGILNYKCQIKSLPPAAF